VRLKNPTITRYDTYREILQNKIHTHVFLRPFGAAPEDFTFLISATENLLQELKAIVAE
jgi:hypothetical protein